MPRAVITLPDNYIFSTDLEIRIGDINYGNHLANDALLALVHESRVRLLNTLGYSEKDVEGCGIIMTDCVIIYKQQAYYGDVLKIQIAVEDFGSHACDLIYLLSNKSTGKETARVKTRIAFFDYQQNKITKIPEQFIQKTKR